FNLQLTRMRRAALIVLDGVGIGPAPDTDQYGDTGSDTLGNVSRAAGGLALPHLEALGLGCCAPLAGIRAVEQPAAAWGIAQPVSAGKDSTTGHWELCGVVLERAFPTYPQGFPPEVLAEFSRRTGRGVLANHAASGTEVIDRYGAEHQSSGKWIVYTSADSVFQIAAHEDTVPLAELYAASAAARDILRPPHGVSRVIARPFRGSPGAFARTPNRKDFSLEPVGRTLLDELESAGIPRLGVGKVDDLFAGRGITSTHTATNADAYRLIREGLGAGGWGLLLANVIEFDQSWGHRNDIPGFLAGLEELDRELPGILEGAQAEDLIIFTADHGNDPTTPSTDHARERVPVLVYGPRVRAVSLGERPTFADVGQTVAEFLGVAPLAAGTSFLREVWGG
ncbi:MAG TPA: phosphopentomutase, partial [Candidatus Udaeobacter sp.]|nr:phosphopentomutase [Candidatus Udaeobacter sp.]